MLLISSAAATDIGNVRDKNEDCVFLCGRVSENKNESADLLRDNEQREAYLYAVCDGMGGELCGDMASQIAAEMLRDYMEDFDQRAEDYFEAVNGRICAEIRKLGGRMGTTFAALRIKDGTARAYNIGDSRVYMQRGGKLLQLSTDDTQAQLMYKQGLISREEVKTHPFRNRLTQHIGIFPQEAEIEPHAVVNIVLREGDRFLLCSDGLTDMLSDDELRRLIMSGDTASAISGSLLRTALENGGRDNISVIAVCVDKAGEDEEELYNFMKDFSEWKEE